MLIHEVHEQNYIEERERGEIEVNKKFALFDALKKSTLTDIQLKRELAGLFKDPTLWAYGTLYDKQNQRLKLFYYQDRIVNDNHRFIHVTSANQVGKTFCICVKAAHHAIFVPNASVMVISKSEQQAVMILDEIKWFLKRARLDYKEIIGEIENRTELHIKGPTNSISVIRCFPPTTSALGFPATLLIADEIAFWEKISDLSPIEYYDQVLEPRTNMTKSWVHPFLIMGQIIFITNPNGQNGIAWRSFSTDDRFHCYRYCWLAYPPNKIEEYLEAKKRLPSYRFASIYGAEYVSADGGFITQTQYEKFASFDAPLSIPVGCSLFLGGDFAGEDVKSRGGDSNVLFGVIQIPNKDFPNFPRIRVVYCREWQPGTEKALIYQEIERLKALPGVTINKFLYDKVGVGDKVKNDLLDRGILVDSQIESLTYSLQNKSEVYLNFQALFEQGMIEGMEITKLREQLLGLQVEQVKGSVHLKIHHKTEGIHDDFVDSLVNACWGAKRSFSVPVSFSFIPHGAKHKEEGVCRHERLNPIDFGGLGCMVCGEEL